MGAGAMLLLSACAATMPRVVDMPYADANIAGAVELMQVERNDTSTVLTFSAMYDYYDFWIVLGDEIYLTTGNDSLPMIRAELPASSGPNGKVITLLKGVPVEFRLIFPALPDDAASLDFIQKTGGRVENSIWGIDLTGKRLANELPAEIPAELLKHDFVNDTLPRMVHTQGIATVKVHVVAFRPWMLREGFFRVNTLADTQETYHFVLDDKGETTVEIPLNGTANISAHIQTNTYASTYVDPGETINMYLLPNHTSEAQRYHRPTWVTDGKYRDLETLGKQVLYSMFQENADTLLLNKRDRDEYFAAMIQIHANGLASIDEHNFSPLLAKYVRGCLDRVLMNQTVIPDAYIPDDWDERDAAKPDSISRFTPEQLAEVRSRIDFSNPIIELRSISNPGNRPLYLKAMEMLKE